MSLAGRLIDAIARAEEALDRLKLRHEERFNRFAPAHIPYRGFGTATELRTRQNKTDEIPGTRIPAVHAPEAGRGPRPTCGGSAPLSYYGHAHQSRT